MVPMKLYPTEAKGLELICVFKGGVLEAFYFWNIVSSYHVGQILLEGRRRPFVAQEIKRKCRFLAC